MTTLDEYQNLMLYVSVQLLSITIIINMCCTFQWGHIIHLQQDCQNSKFGIFELLV